MAIPRRRSNQRATVTDETIDSEPCPNMRIPAKPTISHGRLLTPLITTRAAAKATPMSVCDSLTPRRSMNRPTNGMAAAPVKVPTR